MPQISTKYKIALGYLLLTILLTGTIGYIYSEMNALTYNDNHEDVLNQRRQTANNIINSLNRAEIIGLSLSAGMLNEYDAYNEAMQQAGASVDLLHELTDDTLQQARLDSVAQLIILKKKNTRNLLYIIGESDANRIYKQYIEGIIAEQDSLLNLPLVRHRTVTRTERHSTPSKQKNFLQRLGEVFAPGKSDSVYIDSTIREEYTDTLTADYNPGDTIASLLRDVQNRAANTHQQRIQRLNSHMNKLRLNSLELNRKVHHLLQTIEDEDRAVYKQQQLRHEKIRNRAAHIVAGIAIAALLLAVTFLIIIWRDITRSNHYRKELEKSKQRAEKLLDAREKLMLTITHDIKAPVGSILGYTELLENITHEERQRFYLDNILSSGNHLLALVNSLLDFHRLEADKMETHTVAFNPKELFDSLSTAYIPLADSKNLQFIYECDKGLDDTFGGDPIRIRQITENLLSNALKFTSQGSIGMRISLSEGMLEINVHDTGCGISKEEQEKIFMEFTRLKSAQGEEGFGLGLTITKKMVQLLKGSIEVKSIEREGTSFIAQIPIEKMQTTAQPNELNENDSDQLPQMRLLMIDDDSLQLQLTTAMLENAHTTITACKHPDELLSELQNNDYDIILTDIQMPEMNGFELLKVIRTHPATRAKKVPVIALTARSDMSNEEFISQGFAGCLHKPFTQKELLGKIIEITNEDGFKFQSLTAFSMDDKKATAEIMQTFISETKKKIEHLQQAAAEKRIDQAANIAHQLLPLFRMLNAKQSLPALIWLEQRRNDKIFPNEAEDMICSTIAEGQKLLDAAHRISKECD